MEAKLFLFVVPLALHISGCECGRADAPEAQGIAALDRTPTTPAAPSAPQTQEEKAKAMEEARIAFECFSKIDQVAIKRIVKQGEQAKREIAELCREGQRQEAYARMNAFRELSQQDADMKAMKDCGQGLHNALPTKLQIMLEVPAATEGRHVCDDYVKAE